MKTVFGFLLIILGVVSLFRYPNFGLSVYESLGALIGFALIIVPGILLIRSDIKHSQKK